MPTPVLPEATPGGALSAHLRRSLFARRPTVLEKWRKDLGVTKEQLSYEMGFWNVDGSSAYAVVSGTLTVTIKDQSIVRTGTLAYTFAKREGVWKIEAQAWGRTS
jgi:hypothetical protein